MNSDSQQRDNALNQQLQELVEEIKQYSASNDSVTVKVKRRIGLNKLINTIEASGRLSKQTQWFGLPNYEDYYNEALQLTFIEICDKVDEYNPKYPVMAWVNQIFNWRFIDVINKEQKKGLTNVPKKKKIPPIISLDWLKIKLIIDKEISEIEEIKEIINQDPEKYLINEHVKAHTEANLKAILLLLLEGNKWKEISQELGVSISTVSSFYYRNMHNIIAYLKKYI